MDSAVRQASDAERVSRVIFDYAARIAGEGDRGALLQLNADMARDLVAADRCSIWLIDEERRELWTRVAHGVRQIRVPIGYGIVGESIRCAKPVIVNDVASDSRFGGSVDNTTGYVTKSVLAVPLRSGDSEVIGSFQALNKPGGFSAEDADLLCLAASYSAAVIEQERLRAEAERARLLCHELELARDVQRQLLPEPPPATSGMACAALCRPAQWIGGDYYDFLQPSDGLLAFSMGDVAGKGIAAAVLMATVHSALRTQLLQLRESLAQHVEDLNRAVLFCSTPERYSTLFCGVYDRVSKTLTYVNAGHPPPMLLRAGGSTLERLGTCGPPVGLLEGMGYSEETLTLCRGDVLLCFSDGFSEATNPNDEFWGEGDIERILRQHANAPTQEILEHVLEGADCFADGADQSDDMTILVLRVE